MSSATTCLTRFPCPASADEYARASAELEGRLRGLPGVVAVYRTGSVSVPGISDIDRIAVVACGSRVREIWPTLSEKTRSLAMHGPFVVDPTTFAKHRWFADLQPLELVWGKAIEVEARPAPEHIEPLIAAESLVVFMLKLVKQAAAGRVKVRPTLCELNNIRHDLRLARLKPTDAPEAWTFADHLTRLREDWWSVSMGERVSRFRVLLEMSVPATADALRALDASLQNSGHPGETGHVRLYGVWKNITLAAGEPLSAWRPGRFSRAAARSTRLAEALWRWWPRELAVPVRVVALLDRSPGYEDLRARRQEIVGSYVDFLARTKGYSGIGAAGVFQP